MKTMMYTKTMLEKPIEAMHYQTLLEETNRAYAILRDNPKLWGEEQAERGDWETTLADGLADDR